MLQGCGLANYVSQQTNVQRYSITYTGAGSVSYSGAANVSTATGAGTWTASTTGTATMAVPNRRQTELQWRRTHRHVLLRYVGEWVVLEREQIIAHGRSFADAVREARTAGVTVPYVFRVDGRDEGAATLGL